MPEAKTVVLRWPTPPDCAVFQTAITIRKSALGSYFMAVGFNGGYCGIQDTGEKTSLIFSIWDGPGNDPNSVPEAERARVIRCSDIAFTRRFGGEGTGLQCFGEFDFQSVVGKTIDFKVVATRLDKIWTKFAAFYRPPACDWTFLCSYRARMFGKRLNGFYSFIEDYRRTAESAMQLRGAQFSAACAYFEKAPLTEITQANFSCHMRPDETGSIALSTGGIFSSHP